MSALDNDHFIDMTDVVEDLGISKATINRLHQAGEFPQKVQLSRRRVGWWASEVAAWKVSRDRVVRKA
ncbi:AlpA family phage regulatory protein [Sphingomonas sp. TREG-RG-20F-R18-01]|uniref:helix-turn-helix transcriptional regulator n=1 Tax=Sphingomonas sp. TREG-RG-20F-R18-01 TaxID=2914982 RepID=UPI001F579BFD|nr:AlpA family phage regulatory protein [Sphingomonas sp. TREG-RG-20F-R18-01]